MQTRSPLYSAVTANDHVRVAELLEFQYVRRGIDVGLKVGMLASSTPLHDAVSKGHTEMVAALLKAGADGRSKGLGAPVWASREAVAHWSGGKEPTAR